MSEQTLVAAVEKLASLTHEFSDGDLEQPWSWGAHEEGVRFAYLITYQELQELAVRLRAERQATGRGPSQAQQILGQYIAAYRNLQALLIGITAAEYDQEPAANEWPLRGVLGHVVNAQRPFFALAARGVARWRAGEDRPLEMSQDQMEQLTISTEELVAIWDSGTLEDMQTLYQGLHNRIISDLAGVTDQELEASTLWWEGQPYPVRHRFHRFTAHARQHIIQVEKTLAGIGKPPNEVRQLLRLVYSALAEVEGTLLGAENTGREAQEQLANTISQRADALRLVVDQAHQLGRRCRITGRNRWQNC